MGASETLLDGARWGLLPGVPVDTDDPVVREVISQVEACLDKYDLSHQYDDPSKRQGKHIEVEGRLGVFVDPWTNERLKLPVETEALLCEPTLNSDWTYKFMSSINHYHFDCFCRTIRKELGLSATELAEDVEAHEVVTREVERETMDVFVSCRDGDGDEEDKKMRISFDGEGKKLLEAIQKEPFVKLNVYTGQDAHEDEVQLLNAESGEYHDRPEDLQTAVDFRVSINQEIEVPTDVIGNALGHARERSDTFRRRRSRKSYPLFGVYRIDTTVVSTQHTTQGGGSKSRTSYEIELEINPFVLYHHFSKKQRGLPNKFDVVIANFVYMLRCWAAFLNTNGTLELLTQKRESNQNTGGQGAFGADMTDCAVSDEQLEAYLKYVSPVVPLIGDYAFRTVVEYCQNKGESVLMTEEDVAESVRMHLREDELEELHKQQKERVLSMAMVRY